MRHVAVLALVLPLQAAILSGCENENVAACEAYVERFSLLPCTTGIDPGVDCNAFADYPCAVPDYFSCLETTQQCRDDELFVCKDVADDGCSGKTLGGCPDELDCG